MNPRSTSLDQQETARTPVLRQVRLRLAVAHLYPTLPAGEWLSAATVAGQLLSAVGRAGTVESGRHRILPAEHFEFRGGYREAATTQHRARTRWTDHFRSSVR